MVEWPLMSGATPEIDALYAAWRDAFRRRDVGAVLALLTDDYVLWIAGRPPLTRAMLAPQLDTVFIVYLVDSTFEREECLVAGDLAIDRGWDVQTLRPRDGGPVQVERQRVFLVLRRVSDGSWRFARAMAQPGPPA